MAEFKPRLSPKQEAFMRLCKREPGCKKFVLASGPRMSTKTTVCLNAIASHLWHIPNARFALVSPTVTAGDDSGCWTELCENVIPDWIGGNFGMEWVTEPSQKGTTKKLYFEVTNKHGGMSRCHLDSLQWEEDAEKRFKNKIYSGIYVSELSYYKLRETFDTWRQALRGAAYEEWMFIFIGDTNPAEEGEDSWIWKLWYDERVRDPEDDVNFKLWQAQLELVEFRVSDNIFKDDAWHRVQRAMYQHSEDLESRYYHGKWTKAIGNSVMHDVFRPKIHIIGEYETPTNENPETLVPDENCSELLTGWDIGQVNHAMVIAEKIWRKDEKGKEVSVFKFLDEVVSLKSDYDTWAFVLECMEKIQFWEEYLGHTVLWRNWSDRSAFDQKKGTGNVYDHQIVYQASQGKIVLQAADYQGPGSRRQRLYLVKKLVFEHRWFASRSRCPHIIDSYQSLRPGKGNLAIDVESKYKHAWDAPSYLLAGECYDEIIRPTSEMRTDKAVPSLVSVPL